MALYLAPTLVRVLSYVHTHTKGLEKMGFFIKMLQINDETKLRDAIAPKPRILSIHKIKVNISIYITCSTRKNLIIYKEYNEQLMEYT